MRYIFVLATLSFGLGACSSQHSTQIADQEDVFRPTTQTTDLFDLVASTNAPVEAVLRPEWIGESHETIRNGSFSNESRDVRDAEQFQLRFDWFSHTSKPQALNFGPKTIGLLTSDDKDESDICTWRSSLPTDAELLKSSTVSMLTEFLGPSQGFTDGWGSMDEMHSTASWYFFALKDKHEIETISIFCTITRRLPEAVWRIDGMLVIRGSASPKPLNSHNRS